MYLFQSHGCLPLYANWVFKLITIAGKYSSDKISYIHEHPIHIAFPRSEYGDIFVHSFMPMAIITIFFRLICICMNVVLLLSLAEPKTIEISKPKQAQGFTIFYGQGYKYKVVEKFFNNTGYILLEVKMTWFQIDGFYALNNVLFIFMLLGKFVCEFISIKVSEHTQWSIIRMRELRMWVWFIFLTLSFWWWIIEYNPKYWCW